MHLKNFSLISKDGLVYLSPSYDLVNTTLVLKNPSEEFALPLNGKKRNLTEKDFFRYFAKEKLKLSEKVIVKVKHDFESAKLNWQKIIFRSFLSKIKQEEYLAIIERRFQRLKLALN